MNYQSGGTEYVEKIQRAVAEVEAVREEDKNTLTLSNGVKLQLKSVPLLRIQAISERFKYPDVPEVYDPDKDRTYKNPFDPLYQQMKQEVDVQRTWAILDAVLAFGTKLVYRPDDVPALEGDDWIEDLKMSELAVNVSSPTARYLMWVKYVAVVTLDDLKLISNQFGINMGVSEEQIAQAMDSSFQGDEKR